MITPLSHSNGCLTQKYINSDFDHVVNVSQNMDSIKNVETNAHSITNVSDNMDAVKNVDHYMNDVLHVSGNMDEIQTVNSNQTEIDTVAGNIGEVVQVAQGMQEYQVTETFTLEQGQTSIVLVSILAQAAQLEVAGQMVDGTILIRDTDFTVTGIKKIELKRSYPKGTTLKVTQVVYKNQDDPYIVIDELSAFNRKTVPIGVGADISPYEYAGGTVTPRLLVKSTSYVNIEPIPANTTITSVQVTEEPKGVIVVQTSNGAIRFSSVLAEAFTREEIGKTATTTYHYSARGGETSITIPFVFDHVQALYINGIKQLRDYAWEWNEGDGQVVTLAEALINDGTTTTTDQVEVIVGGEYEQLKPAIQGDLSNGTVLATGSTTVRKLKDRFSGSVNLSDFGAVGDARLSNGSLNPNPTDDTASIQAAILYACIHGQSKVVSDSNKSYHTTSTIYIPTIYRSFGTDNKYETETVIDFQGAEFVGTGTNPTNKFSCFESAYIDINGDLQTTIGTPDNKYLTTGVQLINASLTNYYRGFNLKGWVYGCAVRNIFCVNVAQAVKTHWCFYTHFEQIICRGDYLVGVPRYSFGDAANIQPIKGCITGNCEIGFEFTGVVESLRLVDCGIEGFTKYGVVTKGKFNIKFESCYFETNAPGAIGYSGKSNIGSVTFDNCWGFGSDLSMIGDLADNVSIRIEPNNILGSGARWYRTLPNYCVSDFNFQNKILSSGNEIPSFDAPKAVNVNQSLTIYNEGIGLDAVVGRAAQTSYFHPQKVNGCFSVGFSSTNRDGVGHRVVLETPINNRQVVTYYTNIKWSASQNIYVALRIAHNVDTWTYFANVYGNAVKVNHTTGTGVTEDITVHNENGFVVIKTPSLPVASASHNVAPTSGEIRLI